MAPNPVTERSRRPSGETEPSSISSASPPPKIRRRAEPSSKRDDIPSRDQVEGQLSGDETAQCDAWRIGTLENPEPLDPLPSPPQMLSFGIERDHPLVPQWPPLRDEILEALDESPVEWSALEVLRRRTSARPCPRDDTTIVVTATKANGHDWVDLRFAGKNLCETWTSHAQRRTR